MSKHAMGFVPSAGAGALVIESLASAMERKAKIYAEILGGHINSGGQRGNGTMTIGNLNGMAKCIEMGLSASGVTPKDVDLISGHLTSTIGDVNEIQSWKKALKRSGKKFPWVNSLKSMIGHSLSAAGSIEIVAAVLQLFHGFVHPSLNAEELHPEIEAIVHPSRVPKHTIFNANLNIVAKINFGFGDVNSCLILKKWKS
jgi:3-oxoacyl-(acyl-carrier-protein) synthase